jgi:hypothetical protein
MRTIKRSTLFIQGLILCLFTLCSLNASAQEDSTSLDIDSVKVPDATAPQEEEKVYFKTRDSLDNNSYQYRQISTGEIEKLKKDKHYWYADSSFIKKNNSAGSSYVPLGQRGWFKVLFWLIIIGAFAGALMWYLAGSNVGLFRKKTSTLQAGASLEEMPEDIFAIQYKKQIEKAVASGDYRLAVRLHYLQLLKILSDKNIIRYKQDLTNLDYMFQLNGTSYHDIFFWLTRHYEYCWYGHFDVNDQDYRVIKDRFDQAELKLKAA